MLSYQIEEFGAPLVASESATPEPTGTEILLRVEVSGVCHSDIHLWEGGYDLGRGRRLSFAERGISLPCTMGHEIVGTVLACGPAVRGVAVGDTRLLWLPPVAQEVSDLVDV